MHLARRASLVLPFALALWAPNAASATYSIVAVDLESGAVGGAGTSCVGANLSVYDIYGSAPGYGAVMAQASLNREGRERAVELLAQGKARSRSSPRSAEPRSIGGARRGSTRSSI